MRRWCLDHLFVHHWRLRGHGHFLLTLGCIITFESLYLLALAGSLVSEGLSFVLFFSLCNHSVLSFNVLLLLELLEELFVSDEDAVGVS